MSQQTKTTEERHAKQGRLRNSNPVGDPSQAARCGAQTRSGAACQGPAMANGRCRMHGGPSTGPRTPEGLANSRQAQWKHGLYSAERKRLRRQLRWVGEFARVLSRIDKMFRLLRDIGEAMERGLSDGVLASKCWQVLPLYERYLVVLAAALDSSERRLAADERRLLATLWAGAGGATALGASARTIQLALPDAKRTMAELLASHQQRIEQLFKLALERIQEAFNACQVSKVDGAEGIELPDHRMRLAGVHRFCQALASLLGQK